MFEKMMEISMLFDFYGQLLTQKQKTILQLYYEDDLTLAEIAENLGISRQAVHDASRKAEKALHEYERTLGLVRKFQDTEAAVRQVNECIEQALHEHENDEALKNELIKIKSIMESIGD